MQDIIAETPTNSNQILDDEIWNDPLLADPDSDQAMLVDQHRRFIDESELESLLVASIVTDPATLECAARILDPKIFTAPNHQTIARLAVDYFQSAATIPPEHVLKAMLAEHVKTWKPGKATFAKTQLNELFYICHSCGPASYMIGVMAERCKRLAFMNAFDSVKAGDLAKGFELVEQAKAIGGAADHQFEFEDAIDFLDAEDEKREWLLDGWLASHSVHLFAGEKKLGKSTLVNAICAAVLKGEQFFGRLDVKPCHVLYLDYENPRDYIRTNFTNMMPRSDWEAVRSRFHVPKAGTLPPSMNGEWLDQAIQKLNIPDGEPLVVTLDSGFAAFNGLFSGKTPWENNSSDVRKAIDPLTAVCRKRNAALILIHHDNKSGDSAGSAQWEGAVDYVWHYTKKSETSTERTLSPKHVRWTDAKPKPLVFEKPARTLKLMGDVKEVAQAEHETEEQRILELIPILELGTEPTPENTITLATMRDKLNISNSTMNRRLKELELARTIQKGTFGNNNRYGYYRFSDLG